MSISPKELPDFSSFVCLDSRNALFIGGQKAKLASDDEELGLNTIIHVDLLKIQVTYLQENLAYPRLKIKSIHCKNQSKIYVIGGYHNQVQMSNKVEMLDIRRLNNKEKSLTVRTVSSLNQPRAGFGVCSIKDRYLYVFGGYSIKSLRQSGAQLDTLFPVNTIERLETTTELQAQQKWSKIDINGNYNCSLINNMMQFKVCQFTHQREERVLILGGENFTEGQISNQILEIKIKEPNGIFEEISFEKSELQISSDTIFQQGFIQTIKIDNYLYMMTGYRHIEAFDLNTSKNNIVC
ncbi:UNKNOWN [Stylonychia lemnae]|uniref:Kelch motif family protein n=1 Tax=Stylonychia lemnae TaxID=5949 RepID=A0A078A124_STYLE|nr:UNKNOWN [Stylonychia lemnae]|eukprot:CDW75183.1 UNKNOWN [Stylonychia lemnae]